MTQQLPQRGDIWRDYRGHFLVLDEHNLTDWDRRSGYLCEISILDLYTGKVENHWTISNIMLEELEFVA